MRKRTKRKNPSPKKAGGMKHGTCHHDKLHALRRIEGQIRGVQKMIDEGRYCVDILQLTGAIAAALKKVEARIMKDHLNACVQDSFLSQSNADKKEKLKEIIELLDGYRK